MIPKSPICFDPDPDAVHVAAERQEAIGKVLKTLTYREREVVKLRFGLNGEYVYTLEEVGRIFKATKGRVRQIEAKAIRKLQHPVRKKTLMRFIESKKE